MNSVGEVIQINIFSSHCVYFRNDSGPGINEIPLLFYYYTLIIISLVGLEPGWIEWMNFVNIIVYYNEFIILLY